MIRHLIFCITLLVFGSGAYSQAHLGFTNLDGFPDVIVSNGNYNLSGYIVNTGSDTLFGGLDIRMAVNGGSTLPVDNNFALSNPLAPGDTAYWSKNGHSFPPGQFAPGNNDVVIWPTRQGGNNAQDASDSLEKPVYYAEDAAYRIAGNGIPAFQGGIDAKHIYDVEAIGQNIGAKKNGESVKLYMRIENEPPMAIAENEGTFFPGDEIELKVFGFRMYDLFRSFFDVQSAGYSAEVKFWVNEDLATDPVEFVTYEVHLLKVHLDPGATDDGGPVIYPNPANDYITVLHSSEFFNSVESVRLVDMQGRTVRQLESLRADIDLRGLAPGQYYLRIDSRDGVYTRPIVKQ